MIVPGIFLNVYIYHLRILCNVLRFSGEVNLKQKFSQQICQFDHCISYFILKYLYEFSLPLNLYPNNLKSSPRLSMLMLIGWYLSFSYKTLILKFLMKGFH